MVKEQNIAVNVILSIVTCGIYGFIWMASLTNDIDTVAENPNRRSGGMVVLLAIITCGLYSIYWWYQNGKLLESANQKSNRGGNSNAILYLVLSLVGFSIVNYCIAQADVNKYATPANN